MGVERTDYLMFGVDVGYDAFDWDKHEAEIEGGEKARFDVVMDGMSGKYCIAGKIIACSEPYEGFAKATIDPSEFDADRAELAAKVSDAFSQTVAPEDFRIILFSHFH